MSAGGEERYLNDVVHKVSEASDLRDSNTFSLTRTTSQYTHQSTPSKEDKQDD